MERPCLPAEELNASAKIAPYGWNPVAVGTFSAFRCYFFTGDTDRPTGIPPSQVGNNPKWEPKSVVTESTGNMGWPKLVGSDSVREVPIWSRSLNITQGRLVMSSAVGIQSDLSTTYKSEVTMTKAVNCKEDKWEKGEGSQQRYSI